MADAPESGVLGVRGAVLELAAAAPAGDQAEQLDLLAHRPAGVAIRHDAAAIAAEVERTGKAGRPKGRQNVSTRELKDWLITLLGRTPQEWRIRWLMLEPEELARRLNCSVAEAFDRQDRIADALGRFFMPHLAPVDDKGRAVPGIALFLGDRQANAGPAEAGAQAPWLRSFKPLIEGEQNQGLSETVSDVSPVEHSPVEGKAK